MTTALPTRGRRALRVAAGTVAAAVMAVAGGGVAGAADSAGFYYGSDSNAPAAAGAAYPYTAVATGGRYGGYVGELGTWTNWQGCTTGEALNRTALSDANVDERASTAIPGVFFYWFAAGPGADPGYNGTAAEALRWGEEQAERANSDYEQLVDSGLTTETRYIPLLFMDIETQPVAGYANGWDERVNSCGQITEDTVIPTVLDRETFDGFYDYVHDDTIFHPGVYSTADYWAYTFGTGVDGSIPNTYEWTPVVSTARVTPDPVAFCQASDCAEWFGGVDASREAGWQWDQNGGDYDQWDTSHLPT